MSREIGPREKALREMREARFEQGKEAARKLDKDGLRDKVATIPARKPGVAKKKRL